MKLITLSLYCGGSKVYVNPKNICAIFSDNGITELLFAGGDGGNCLAVIESVDTVAKMVERSESSMYFTTVTN